MKIKVGDLYDLSLGLDDLAGKDLEVSTSLKVERNQRNVSEELLSTDKLRQQIADKHKEKDIGEGVIKLTDDGTSKMNELMDQDLEIKLQKIKINELDGIRIKPRSLRFLKAILDQEESAEK